MKYLVKCDDCKQTLRGTDSMRESAEGGHCDKCKGEAEAGAMRIGMARKGGIWN